MCCTMAKVEDVLREMRFLGLERLRDHVFCRGQCVERLRRAASPIERVQESLAFVSAVVFAWCMCSCSGNVFCNGSAERGDVGEMQHLGFIVLVIFFPAVFFVVLVVLLWW